jgi:hypothetical protein
LTSLPPSAPVQAANLRQGGVEAPQVADLLLQAAR